MTFFDNEPYVVISSLSLSDGCWYCGKEEADTWDHIVPRSLGGIGEVENLVPCCKPCNSRKSAKPLYKFRKYLKKKGMPCDFDTPDPIPIFGNRILKGDCYFESLDGNVKIDQMEYFNRIYVNET